MLLLLLHRLDESFKNVHKLFVFLIFYMYIVKWQDKNDNRIDLIGLNIVFTKLLS